MSIRTSSPKAADQVATAVIAVVLMALAPSPADAKRREAAPAPVAYAPPPPPPRAPTGSIFNSGDGYAALYEGWRARRVGDPLTIILVERTIASKSASSNLDSKGGLSLTPPVTGALSLFTKTDASISGTRGFTGVGTTDQANSLSGEVSVTVVETYPNGTMLVQGQKRVTLNRGDEWIKIRGLIRAADVDANNRVGSNRVADADISYTGKGDVARASRQGWLSRFFSVVSPF